MPRWVWFLPVGALTAALGLWGFRMGWIASTITETEVIHAYAQRYLAERAAQGAEYTAAITDCVAYPAVQRGVWIVVSCEPGTQNGDVRYTYHVNRFGGLVSKGKPAPNSARSDASLGAPET